MRNHAHQRAWQQDLEEAPKWCISLYCLQALMHTQQRAENRQVLHDGAVLEAAHLLQRTFWLPRFEQGGPRDQFRGAPDTGPWQTVRTQQRGPQCNCFQSHYASDECTSQALSAICACLPSDTTPIVLSWTAAGRESSLDGPGSSQA